MNAHAERARISPWIERRAHRYVRLDRRDVHGGPGALPPLLFDEVAESCPVGIVVIAADGHIRYTNTRAQQMLGLSRADYESRDYNAPQWRVTDFDGQPLADEALAFSRVLHDGGAVMDAEHAVERADGTRLYLRVSGQPVFDGHGVVQQVICTMTDVSAAVLSARALRHSEKLFESALDHAPIGMALVGLDGRWVKVNQAICRITGYTRAELLRLSFQDITHSADLDADLDNVRRLLAGEIEAYRMVKRYIRKDRVTTWIELSVSLLRDESGAPLHFISQIVDLSAQRAHEEKLRASEERFRLMIDSVLDYEILMLDPEGRVLNWNAGAERIKGYEAEEIIGRHFSCFYTDEDQAAGKPQRELKNATRDGRYEDEGWRLRKDGTRFWANVILTAIRGDDGALRGYCKLTRDQTERRRAETDLRESRLRLEDSMLLLQRQNREMTLFSEFSGVLQSCLDYNEVAASIRHYGRMLFPQCSGALYLLQPSRSHLEPAGGWGAEVHAQDLFAPQACWALRRGQPHHHGGGDDLCCTHVTPDAQRVSLCVPMIAQNDTLGLLYLEAPVTSAAELSHHHALAVMLAERLGMSVANLRLRESLRQQSIRDTLTQLYNRRYLEESVQRELASAQRAGSGVAVLMIDVDHFKDFNDRHGHEAGDWALRMLARQLEKSCRQSDIACRYGGEEFTLVLSHVSAQQALAHAQALCDVVRGQELFLHGHALGRITVSVGVALYPQHGTDLQTLLAVADRALYQAKNTGRDRALLSSESAQL